MRIVWLLSNIECLLSEVDNNWLKHLKKGTWLISHGSTFTIIPLAFSLLKPFQYISKQLQPFFLPLNKPEPLCVHYLFIRHFSSSAKDVNMKYLCKSAAGVLSLWLIKNSFKSSNWAARMFPRAQSSWEKLIIPSDSSRRHDGTMGAWWDFYLNEFHTPEKPQKLTVINLFSCYLFRLGKLGLSFRKCVLNCGVCLAGNYVKLKDENSFFGPYFCSRSP